MVDATPLFRLYAALRRRQLASQDPVAAQRRTLRALLRRAAATRFGRDHGFAQLTEVEDYQQAVPLRNYDAFWRAYWRPAFPRLADCSWPGVIPFFAVTSGTTTGATKYIPCTRAMIGANRRAMLDLVTFHLTARPGSRLFGGRNFMLGGSTALKEEAPGIWSGDLSGISSKTMPAWVRPFYFPPRRLETIADWEQKIAAFAPAALKADIRSIGGTPSWLLLFFDLLAERLPGRSRRLVDAFPKLELVVHGGVNFAPYRHVFAERLAGSHAETREVYPASEGFIAAADRGDGEGLRLMVDNGLFLEFVPLDELDSPSPTRHWLATAQTGVNYALVLSSCAGLWSYIIGDTVRFVSTDPPRILVTGRTSYDLSAFGEHLIGEEIETAVTHAAAALALNVKDFSVGPLFTADQGAGRHLYIIEFAEGVPPPETVTAFAGTLDARLASANDDYRVHRAGDFGMRAPLVHPAAPGTFAAWMKERGRLGGQNKVPRVITNDALFASLRAAAGSP